MSTPQTPPERGGPDRPLDLRTRQTLWVPERLRDPDSWIGHVPFAFWLVGALEPEVLVELGTYSGNSYFAFCQAVAGLGLGTRCVAVDTWEGDEHAGYYAQEVHDDVAAYNEACYAGFSELIRSTFDEARPRFADASIDLLHIDGCHSYEAVRHDFESWLPKLSERGVVLLHDINVERRGFGVSRLWRELVGRFPAFAFFHSYGLGVLAVGARIPEAVRPLFEASSDPDAADGIRAHFERLGSETVGRFALQSLRSDAGRLAAEIAELRAEAARRDAELASALERTAALHGEIRRLRESVEGLRRSRTASRRFGAPVRWVGRVLRRARSLTGGSS